ncbi:zinc finger BED domain-containing protein 5-like, partial [Aphis craccivora]
EVLEDSTKVTLDDLNLLLQQYLDKLQLELDRYIPENVELSKYSWVRNPFEVSVHEVGEDICGFQEELIDLQANQVLKENFSQKCLTQFWAQLKDKPILTRESEKALLPFPTTYLCEAGFSDLVVIKTKYRNRLDAQHDMRCALSMNIHPNIEELVNNVQYQGSH